MNYESITLSETSQCAPQYWHSKQDNQASIELFKIKIKMRGLEEGGGKRGTLKTFKKETFKMNKIDP